MQNALKNDLKYYKMYRKNSKKNPILAGHPI